MTDQRLTSADELFIASRLLSRARHTSRKILNAANKPLHPELMKQMREDVAECTRLAVLLQEERPAGPQTCTEKDAARYEWLRENWKGLMCHTSCSPSGRHIDRIEVVETLGQDLDPQSLDHAIDAAMVRDDEKEAARA